MPTDVMPVRRRFTVAEYKKMAATGIFGHEERVELIDGEVLEIVAPSTPHAAFVMNLSHLLVPRVHGQAVVWVNSPVRVPPRSMPQPDLALLRMRSYRREGATTEDAMLFIEVADVLLEYARTVKLRLYAQARIPEYWIVDVDAETVEVHRSPSGEQYAIRQIVGHGASLAPLAFPNAALLTDKIFV